MRKRKQSMKPRKIHLYVELMKLRNDMRKEEIMEAVIKSEHSYEEIMAFIKGTDSEA